MLIKDAQLQRLKALPQDKISTVVVILLLIYIAYVLAKFTWLAIPQPEQSPIKLPTQNTSRTTSSSQVDISRLLSSNLFGVAAKKEEAAEEAVVEEVQDAPKTQLNLRLTGVVAVNGDDKRGSAIIESANQQESYFVGDNVKGTSAKLSRIYSDRVLLQVGRRLETLMLDGIEYTKRLNERKIDPRTRPSGLAKSDTKTPKKARVKASDDAKKIDNRKDRVLAKALAEKKRELLSNPAKIFDFIQVQPHRRNGEVIGYRLRPARDPKLFVRSGLRTNDVAIEINGHQLSDTQEAMMALRELKEMTEARIIVERRGEIVEVLFSLDDQAPVADQKKK